VSNLLIRVKEKPGQFFTITLSSVYQF